MSPVDDHEVTKLLSAFAAGDARARDRLFDRVYAELHRVAAAFMQRQRPDHVLEPTGLVNEAYLRLVRGALPDDCNRKHFFALAARVMRQVLVDHARRRGSAKRGGRWGQMTLSAAGLAAREPGIDALEIDEALERLAAADERKARLVELRFFAGLTLDEAADVLDIARATAADDWAFARAWLLNELRDRQTR